MHDVRADIDTPALSALRSDGATYGAGAGAGSGSGRYFGEDPLEGRSLVDEATPTALRAELLRPPPTLAEAATTAIRDELAHVSTSVYARCGSYGGVGIKEWKKTCKNECLAARVDAGMGGLGCFCCGAWLYLRTRGEARRARRHERMLEREHLQESPSGRPHEELGTEL